MRSRLCLALLSFFFVQQSYASCTATFPDAVSNSDNGGSLNFNWLAHVHNSPDNILDTTNLIDGAGWNNSCDGVSCSASGNVVPAADWSSFPGGSSVTVPFLGSRTIFPGDYNSITINSSGTLRMHPGDYTIQNDLDVLFGGDIDVVGSGTVRIFVDGDIDFDTSADINQGGTPDQLFIFSSNTIDFGFDSNMNGFAYAEGNITLSSFTDIFGAITSGGNVLLYSSAEITYDSSALGNVDFGTWCSAGATVDHFVIDIGGAGGSTCFAKEISIVAEDSSNNTVDTYDGTVSITVSTSHGDWSVLGSGGSASSDPPQGALVPGGADSGSASYTFIPGTASDNDAGSIAIFLSNTHADDLTITVNDSSLGVSSTSSVINFRDNAFVIESSDSLLSDVVAMRDHDFTATLWQRDSSLPTPDCSVATGYTGSKSLKAWINRSVNDPNGTGPTIDGSVTLPDTAPGANNVSINFSAGVANFDLETTDVGRYAINLRDDSRVFATGVDIDGSSSDYTVRPFGFDIQVTGNPAAEDHNGTVFETAGDDFSVSVRAVGWESADDSNNDGVPDNHDDSDPDNNADLGHNQALSSFGQEGAGESVSLSAVLFAPSGGTDPGLGDGSAVGDGRVISSFSSGVGSTSDVKFSEVGIIEIFAAVSDGDYLSAGVAATDKSDSASSFVGRFIPDYLAVSNNTINEACGTFSYMEQSFTADYRIQAFNADDAVTSNYRDDFIKLTASLGSLDFGAVDSGVPTLLSSRLNNPANSFSNGNGLIDISSTLTLSRTVSPDGLYPQLAVGVLASDDDSVTLRNADLDLDVDNDTTDDHFELGSTELRYGRVVLENAHGPEIYNLPVEFKTQYWTGSIFVDNVHDSCTQIAMSDITYPDGTIDVLANLSVSVGGGSSTGSYADVTGGFVNFTNGVAGHSFSAPGQGNTGSFNVSINMTAYPWLRFDWNGDSSDDLTIQGTYTFGSYRGSDRIIHWREVFQ